MKILNSLGFIAATPLDNGLNIVVGVGEELRDRASLGVVVEEYGIHIEGERIAQYSDDIYSLSKIHKLRRIVEERAEFLRVDVSEDDWIVLTSALNSVEDIPKALKEFKELIPIAKYVLNTI